MATVASPDIDWIRNRTVHKGTVRFLERHRFTGLPTAWTEIVGHDHAKRELRVVAAALSRRDVAERLGVPLVKGILITGPSGSGKTLLARAFAGAVERPVFVLSAAEMTAARLRRVYETLADIPSVVVIDEIDVIAGRAYGRAARSRTVAAICVALDGIVPVTGPITIGLTAEEVDAIDPSVVRSGRLTTKIVLETPDRGERLALFEMYTARVPTHGTLDLVEAADRTQDMTGADIAAMTLAAAGLALADGLEALDQAHLDEALERRGLVRATPQRDERSRLNVATHEAGHAVFAFGAFGADALNEMAIARSGRGEGHTSLRTEWSEANDSPGWQWRLRVQLSLAGLIAEELLGPLGAASFGSHADIDHATTLVLGAIEHGLVPDFGRVSPTRLEKGRDPESYDERGSEAMRAAQWEVVHAELRAAETACRLVLEPQAAAIREVAERLLAVGVLSGPALIEALRTAGAREALA